MKSVVAAVVGSLLMLLLGHQFGSCNKPDSALPVFAEILILRSYGVLSDVVWPIRQARKFIIVTALTTYATGQQSSEIEHAMGKPRAIDGPIKLAGWPKESKFADQNWLYDKESSNLVLSFSRGRCVAAQEYDYSLDLDWQQYKVNQLKCVIPGLRKQEVIKLLNGIEEVHPHYAPGQSADVHFPAGEADEVRMYEIGYSTWLAVGWKQNTCLGGEQLDIFH